VIHAVTCPHRRRPVPQDLGERGRVAAAQRLQVSLEGVVAAGVALVDDLGVQRGGISRTGREPLVQVRLELVEFAGPRTTGDQLLDAVGKQVAAHGLEVHAEPAGDYPHRQALHPQSVDFIPPPLGVLGPCWHRLSHMCQLSATCKACGAPSRAPSA
jgi:hypothetical protein